MTWTGHHFSRPVLNQAAKARLITVPWIGEEFKSPVEDRVWEKIGEVRQIGGQAAAFVALQEKVLVYSKNLVSALNNGNLFLVSPDFGNVKHPLVYKGQLVEADVSGWSEDSFTDRSSQLECITAWESMAQKHRNADSSLAKKNYYIMPLPWFQIVHRNEDGFLRNLLADDLDGVNIVGKTNEHLLFSNKKPLVGHKRGLFTDFRSSYYIVKKAYLDSAEACKDANSFIRFKKENSCGDWDKDWDAFKKQTQEYAGYLIDLIAYHLSLLLDKTSHGRITVISSAADPTFKVAESLEKYCSKQFFYIDFNRNAEYPADGLHNRSGGNIVSGYQVSAMEKEPNHSQYLVQDKDRLRGCKKRR